MNFQIKNLVRGLPPSFRDLLTQTYVGGRHLLSDVMRPYYVAARTMRRNALPRMAEGQQPITLFLSPDAGLTPFYAAHAILAKSASENGEAAVVLSCDGALPTCLCKGVFGVKATQPGDTANRACRACRLSALSVGQEYGLVDITIDSLLGAVEKEAILEILGRNEHALWEAKHDDILFGAAALGEVLRERKKLSVDEFDAGDHAQLRAMLYSSLAIYFAVEALSKTYAIKRIAFYGTYAYWIPTLMFARKHDIATTSFEHAYNMDIDRRSLLMRGPSAHEELQNKIDSWPDYRSHPIAPSTVADIAHTALFRLRNQGGKTLHSPVWIKSNEKFHASLGLSPDKKTIVAYSSSADEYSAGEYIMKACGKDYRQEARPFENNLEWLQALVDWAETRPDLQLVVRLHPRLAAGAGRAKASEYAGLKRQFATTPKNTVIIWPKDNISSYNLAEIADVVTVAWSTLALELSRFGVPIVSAFAGIGSYPTGTFIGFEPDRPRYFQRLNTLLQTKESLTTILEAFRWTHFLFMAPLVDLSDLVPSMDFGGIPHWKLPRNFKDIAEVLSNNGDLSTLNMARLPGDRAAKDAEMEAIFAAVSRFVAFFITGDIVSNSSLQNLRSHDDFSVTAEIDGRSYHRYSPIAHRMTLMLEQAMSAKPGV